jgi:hypothetical protein
METKILFLEKNEIIGKYFKKRKKCRKSSKHMKYFIMNN